MGIDEILDCLDRKQRRATYGAVGEVLGIPARSVNERLLGERSYRASWIVNAKTGQPTGYAPHEKHPELPASRIIRSGKQLRLLLERCADGRRPVRWHEEPVKGPAGERSHDQRRRPLDAQPAPPRPPHGERLQGGDVPEAERTEWQVGPRPRRKSRKAAARWAWGVALAIGVAAPQVGLLTAVGLSLLAWLLVTALVNALPGSEGDRKPGPGNRARRSAEPETLGRTRRLGWARPSDLTPEDRPRRRRR